MKLNYKYFLAPLCMAAIVCSNPLFAQDMSEYKQSIAASVSNRQKKTYGPWISYPTRTIQNLNGYVASKVKTNQYGGRLDKQVKATGFFHTTNINGRWWCVDPKGNLFFNIGLNNVAPGGSQRNKEFQKSIFGNSQQWADKTQDILKDNGFNCLGAWSSVNLFKQTEAQQSNKPIAYTIIKNFMSEYGKKRGGTYQESGHIGYPDRTIFVFDPEFEAFCDQFASQLAVNKDDQNLFGYFSDNELPFEQQSLDRYLAKKDTTDPGCVYAKQWLKSKGIAITGIDSLLRNEFLGVMADKYFSIVSAAIKKYDPNHMYLGSRLHSYEKKIPQVLKAVGKYVDIIAINYYHEWTPATDRLNNWTDWSGKPFMITEWYVKGEDSQMTNYSGAGWIVKTQEDRGSFYQNYALRLLESSNCVGFHWFQYQDNDPSNEKVDPSNVDANKGIVNYSYTIYTPLIEKMKELNMQVYSLIDFFDKRKKH